MGIFRRRRLLWFVLLMICFCLCACKNASDAENQVKIIVTDVAYNIRQTHENSYVLDARGKVKNVGEADAKKVVITGYCKSCILEFTSQHWFTSDCAKTPNQVDTISYLAAGAEEDFSFEEVAFYFTHEKVKPEIIPENIQIVVESFDVVE